MKKKKVEKLISESEDSNGAVIAVDLDNTLTDGGLFWKEDPEPNKVMLEKLESWYKDGHRIVIHTARREDHRGITEAWLKRHGVWYHALVMEKLSADVYIDDKAVNVDEVTNDEWS